MPVLVVAGPVTGTSVSLTDPQKLLKGADAILRAEKPEGYETFTNQQKADWLAEWLAQKARAHALRLLRDEAVAAASAAVYQNPEV